MKRYLLLFSVLIIGLSACTKNEVATQAAVDDAKIQVYLKANYSSSTFTKDPSGIYYMVVTPGTGAYPVATSTIQVAYTAMFLDGQTFDSSPNTPPSPLSGFVPGFQTGMLHINKGGRILMIIPSALAYGTVGNGAVPANAVLVFKVDLIGFY